jgi:hypothetical protein
MQYVPEKVDVYALGIVLASMAILEMIDGRTKHEDLEHYFKELVV